jgi:hypothetical protein
LLLGNWDLLLAIATAGAFLWFVLPSSRPLDDVKAFLGPSVAYGVAIAGAATVVGRWISDRMKDTAYGEMLRVIDPGETRVQRPTYIVATAGLLTSLLGLVLVLTYDEFDRTVTGWAYGALIFLAAYDLFGLADLYRQSRRHLARMSTVQATREQDERRRRGAKP